MNAETRRYWEQDRAAIWHPFTTFSALAGEPFPIMVRGDGPYLFSSEGDRYFDAISSWWACNLGHGQPHLVDAIVRQARELQHSILGNLSHPRVIELATRLIATFPDARRRVLFASDGASAVEAALRVAVQYAHNLGRPRRCRFLAFKEGYHGDTFGAMSLGFMSGFHAAYRDVVMPVFQAEPPNCYPCAFGKTPGRCRCECFASMKSLVETHADELAAVIVEPHCQGAAGMRMYAPKYLKRLSALCRATGVLLIVDEIAMGFGRTGKMYSFEHAGIDPDIVCLGKGLTGGYLPMSMAVVREEIYRTFDDRPVPGQEPGDHTLYHGHTFAGNPLAAAAALACLELYKEAGIVAQSAKRGHLLAKLVRPFAELPGVANLRTLGMIAAFDLLPGRNGDSGAARARRIRQRLLQDGILLRPLGNVLYLMPPLITPDALLGEVVNSLARAVLEDWCRA